MADEHATESPLPQIVAGSIEEVLARGSERGYVTYDELSATVPLDQLSSEEIEDRMTIRTRDHGDRERGVRRASGTRRRAGQGRR